MCEYVALAEGKCKITKEICPYVFFCNKIHTYKESKHMPEKCKIKNSVEVPKGFYKVQFQRKNKLYVSVDNQIVIVSNPFDFTPDYVKLTKLKSGAWKIKETK